jgi:anti-sigma factor RsiW
MSCSPFDLRDYLLDELGPADRRQVEKHVGTCTSCHEELARLQLTEAALRAVADEEIPQCIAFVSDKVFEPSPWRRAWQAFWGSSARLAFASAAMLSVALVVVALHRPVPQPAGPAPAAQVDPVRLQADFDQRLNGAVQKAVAESEARQTQKTTELIEAARKRDAFERQAFLLQVAQNFDVLRKKTNRLIIASADMAAQQGESK